MRFVWSRGRLEARLEPIEAQVLQSLAVDLLELLGPQDAAEQDPLEALVGLQSGPVARPTDPALARLLPDAYRDDDEAAGEFRRFTEQSLRSGKRAQAEALRRSLAPYVKGRRIPLERQLADAWLGCLNDLRLVLGTRLEVTEETELDPARDDPRAEALSLYGWLGWVQESLLAALSRR